MWHSASSRLWCVTSLGPRLHLLLLLAGCDALLHRSILLGRTDQVRIWCLFPQISLVLLELSRIWIRMKNLFDLCDVRVLDHARCERLMVSDTSLARLTTAARVFNRSRIVLFLLLSIPCKLVSSAEFWVLLLLEETFLSCIMILHGTLPAKLGL